MATTWYCTVYEILEVIGEDPREIPAAMLTEDHKLYMLVDRAAFSLTVMGWAWAEKREALERLRYPDRVFTHRKFRVPMDIDPPFIGG